MYAAMNAAGELSVACQAGDCQRARTGANTHSTTWRSGQHEDLPQAVVHADTKDNLACGRMRRPLQSLHYPKAFDTAYSARYS